MSDVCKAPGCIKCRTEREGQEHNAEIAAAEERAKYSVALTVFDAEMDSTDFEDIGSFTVTEGMLVIFDHERRTLHVFAPGCWREIAVEREERPVVSTDDEPKDD